MNNILEQRNGLVGTIVMHALVILLLVFFGFRTPLPLPPEQGLLVNFGNSETGFGAAEPEDNTPSSAVSPPVEPVQEETQLTQDIEDAPAIEKKKETPKEVKKTVEKKTVEVKKTVTQPVEEVKKVNSRAMYTGKKPDGGAGNSEGITEGTGNQGVENGSPNAPNYGPGGGTGNGAPIFSLAGRESLSLPSPVYSGQESGAVVVDIKVNTDGKVTWAQPGGKGSTTLAPSLLEAARKAALAARFDVKRDAAVEQKGTIKYVFKLN